MVQVDIYTLIGIMVAIGLAVFSPSFPRINSTINLINGFIVFFILLLLVILLNVYLKERKRKDILEEKIEKINQEVSFIKERFKMIEDLSGLRTKLEFIEKRLFKNEKR